MSKGWAAPGMRTRAQRRQREQMLADNVATNDGMCTLAIEGVCTGKATQVHHTLGIAVTGHDPRYMVPACAECNHHVGDPAKAVDPPHLVITDW